MDVLKVVCNTKCLLVTDCQSFTSYFSPSLTFASMVGDRFYFCLFSWLDFCKNMNLQCLNSEFSWILNLV